MQKKNRKTTNHSAVFFPKWRRNFAKTLKADFFPTYEEKSEGGDGQFLLLNIEEKNAWNCLGTRNLA